MFGFDTTAIGRCRVVANWWRNGASRHPRWIYAVRRRLTIMFRDFVYGRRDLGLFWAIRELMKMIRNGPYGQDWM